MTWECVSDLGASQEHWRVRVEAHALVHAPHQVLELHELRHRWLCPFPQHCIHLRLSLHKVPKNQGHEGQALHACVQFCSSSHLVMIH